MRGLLAFVTACFALISCSAMAQQPKPLFAASDPIHIVIQAPLSTLIHNRSDQVVQGTLTDPNGQALPVALSVRGITRRSTDVCDFPPLRVQFTTAPPPTSLFKGQKKLKLVTHCKSSIAFQQKVLLEYSVYQNVQSADSAQLPRAPREHRLSRSRWPSDRLAHWLFPRGPQRRRRSATG